MIDLQRRVPVNIRPDKSDRMVAGLQQRHEVTGQADTVFTDFDPLGGTEASVDVATDIEDIRGSVIHPLPDFQLKLIDSLSRDIEAVLDPTAAVTHESGRPFSFPAAVAVGEGISIHCHNQRFISVEIRDSGIAESLLDFPVIAFAVAIRIGIVRIGSRLILFDVHQAVAVHIFTGVVP